MGSFYIKIAALKHLPKSVGIYIYEQMLSVNFSHFTVSLGTVQVVNL